MRHKSLTKTGVRPLQMVIWLRVNFQLKKLPSNIHKCGKLYSKQETLHFHLLGEVLGCVSWFILHRF